MKKKGFKTLVISVLFFYSAFLHGVCDQAWVGDNFGNVVVIDTDTQMQTSVFQPGDEVASGIAFTPDGTEVFLTDAGNGIYVIDAATQTTIQISTQLNCTDVVISPNGQFAYIPFSNHTTMQGFILQVNTTTLAQTVLNATPYINFEPNGIAITPDGSELYIVDLNTVLVVSATNGAVLQTITIPNAMDLFKVAITPDGAFAYVTDKGTFGTGGNVFQINTSTFSIAAVSVGGFLPFEEPWGVVINPNGQFAYVTDMTSDVVDVIQISSNTVVAQLMDPSFLGPEGIAITPDGSFLYVADFFSQNTVSVINTTTFAVNAVPTSAMQPIVIAISPACPPVPPVSGLSGEIIKNIDFWQTDIYSVICWSPPQNFTPTEYLIYRNNVLIATVSANQLFFKQHYLRPHKTYVYSVYAVNSMNNTLLIGTVTLKT